MLMKVIRPLDTIKELNADELVRYALSLDGPHGITVGMDSMKVLESNLRILKEFKPMSSLEMKRVEMALTPFFHHENLPWMNEDYFDGFWS